uniref:NADH:ubiquinone reductase (H(+)-translocating) n=1 Tax=Capillaria sp. cat-2018 TaxID=2488633 RepID=A0A6M2UJK4_9BILA|nr:NADH dehydrogenase subunit 5 [Capillaria sp. cat-2018]
MSLIILYYLLVLIFILGFMFFLKGVYGFISSSMMNTDFNLSLMFDNHMMVYFTYVVIILSFVIVMYANFYMEHDLFVSRFLFLLLSFIISMIVLNLSYSCWMLWLGWEGLGVTSFLLIIYYFNWKSSNSSMVTLMLNRLGDFSLLLGLLSFCLIQSWNVVNFKFSPWILILVVLAMVAKSAQIPLQSWLPAAMAAPTPVSSLVHSSTLVVAGTVLCLKFNNYFFSYSMYWLALLGFLTSFYASIMAYVEQDFKKIMAYSTMSQIAMIMFMLSTNLNKLMFMHIMNHAFAKALLFLSVGVYIMYMFGSQEARMLELKMYSNKMSSFLMMSCLLVMCGIYFLSCYYSKEFVLLFSYYQETLMLITNVMIFLSLAYSLRLIIFLIKSLELKLKPTFLSNVNYMSMVLFMIMISNGWFMIYNYSMPFNLQFSMEKNYLMLVPLLIVIFSILYYKNLEILNLDYLYQSSFYPSWITMENIKTKLKTISLSMNFVSMQFSFMINMKMLTLPFLFMLILLLIFYLN